MKIATAESRLSEHEAQREKKELLGVCAEDEEWVKHWE